MIKRFLSGFFITITAGIFFFGCGGRPGEKLYHKALIQWKQGNTVRAQTLLEKSISRRAGSPENAAAYNYLGMLLWETGDVKKSVDAFNECLRIDNENYAALCNLGVALSSMDDPSGAEQAFREAMLLQPNDPRPLGYAGIVYTQNEKWNDAAYNLQRALSQTPDDPRLENALALAELHTEGTQAALNRLSTLISKTPDYPPALFNKAAIYRFWLDDQQQAKIWFKRYLEEASGIDAFSAIARAQLQALSKPVSTPTLSIAKPAVRNRKKAEQYFKEAVNLHRAGETSEAIKKYTSAIEADDSYYRAFYNLGLAYYTLGKMALAGESFEQAVKLNPAFIDARYNLALVCHYHLGETPKAMRLLNTILAQQPDYQPAIDLLERIKTQ